MSSHLTESVQDVNKYPFKSGMIKYKLEGRVEGTEEIYFDNYGNKLYDLKTVCHETKGILSCDSSLRIVCSDTIIILNTSEQTACSYFLEDTVINCNNNIVSADILESMGFFKSGTDNITGVICNIYSGENGTMWVWNNIIIKSEMEIMNINMKMEAVEILTEIDVADSKFKLPKNYKLIN